MSDSENLLMKKEEVDSVEVQNHGLKTEEELVQERREKRKRIVERHEEERLKSSKSKPVLVPVPVKIIEPTLEIIPAIDAEESEDDMFADEPKQIETAEERILNAAPLVRDSMNPALTGNWDDPDGYYRIVLGEKLNDQYHVYSNLGKGGQNPSHPSVLCSRKSARYPQPRQRCSN